MLICYPSPVITSHSGYFPITVLTGPRQSGKTTLLRNLFPDRNYVSLEDPDSYRIIAADIRGFLDNPQKWIIDETQRSYL